MQNRNMLVCLALVMGLLSGLAWGQIPTVEEHIRNSSLNPEYRKTWRSGFLRLPMIKAPEKDKAWIEVCYRKEFELSAEPRMPAKLTLYIHD